MKKRTVYGLVLGVMLIALAGAALASMRAPAVHAAANCIQNVDGNGDSAAVVNPPGTFSGTLDATGCVFGIYVGPGFSANIKNATIFGAIDTDIAIDGSANITDSQLTQSESGVAVGETQSAQAIITGDTIEYRGFDGIDTGGSATTVVVDGTHITGPSTTGGNIAIFLPAIGSATVTNSTLTNNNEGISMTAGTGYRISGNNLQNNPTGINAFDTKNVQITNNILNTGQTGIRDSGTSDRIQDNSICHYTVPIDTSGATNPIVSGNHTNC